MTGDFAEFRDDLGAVARKVLAGTAPLGRGGEPGDPVDVRTMAESGWLGLEVSAEHDGSDATFAEVAVVLHELGRAVAVSSYLASAVLGVGALLRVEPDQGVGPALAAVASGELKLAVAGPTGDGSVVPVDLPYVIRAGDPPTVQGRADFVPDAADADRILLLAADPAGRPVLAAVDPTRLHVSAQPVVDPTRRLATVEARDVELEAGCLHPFAGDPGVAVREILDRGALAAACDSLGLAEAVLETTVSYVGDRRQFGRPVGSFQAVKHACADMLVQLTVARELVAAAVTAVAAGQPDAWIAVSQAKSYTGAAAVDIAGKAVQLHGGIGYTWESGVHLYLKRAALNRSLYGGPAAHRRRLAGRWS